jgi:hypothetical protein
MASPAAATAAAVNAFVCKGAVIKADEYDDARPETALGSSMAFDDAMPSSNKKALPLIGQADS